MKQAWVLFAFYLLPRICSSVCSQTFGLSYEHWEHSAPLWGTSTCPHALRHNRHVCVSHSALPCSLLLLCFGGGRPRRTRSCWSHPRLQGSPRVPVAGCSVVWMFACRVCVWQMLNLCCVYVEYVKYTLMSFNKDKNYMREDSFHNVKVSCVSAGVSYIHSSCQVLFPEWLLAHRAHQSYYI